MSRFPWWCSVLLAIAAYCGLKYGVTEFFPEESRLIGLIQLFAPLTAMGFLLLAGKQLYDEDQTTSEKEQTIDEQKHTPEDDDSDSGR